MKTLTQQVQSRLERFEFQALFREVLGWAGPSAASSTGGKGPAGGRWRAVARGFQATVVEVALERSWDLSPAQRQQMYWAIAAQVDQPLVIFLSASRQRSLWMWADAAEGSGAVHSQVYIRGQADGLWASRLAHLHLQRVDAADPLHPAELLAGLSADRAAAGVEPHFQAFQTALRQIYGGIEGIGRISDRKHYALVVLCRLMALFVLQRYRWLDQGDEWYLHNRFGQSQQQGPDRFFREILLPLWLQGFPLPPQERPLGLQDLGEVPFLPTGPFQQHWLERQYGQVQIADVAFEGALDWLGDLAKTAAPDQMLDLFGPVFEQFVNQTGEPPWVTPEPMVRGLCDRTLELALLHQMKDLPGGNQPSLDDLLMAVSASNARALLELLPHLTVLDPACGSGRYLTAALRFLTQTGSALAAILQVTPKASLPDWLQAIPGFSLTLTLQRRILNGVFMGIDLSAEALELGRLQLFLQLVRQVRQPQELQGLPDLSLTLLQGNALIGLITVDSERFDQVQGRAVDAAVGEADLALQGNLLQPLLAENYRSTLAERQIRLEHYRDQTYLLSEVDGIPGYVQAEFLRDRLLELNRTAQHRLNQLLLSEFSQQLGIRYRQSDRQGRQQRRPLTLTDIQALKPFHWGFHVHQLLLQGGFDVVLCHPPWASVQSSPDDFFATFEDLFERKGITLEAFRHHRKQLLTIDADLATAWRDYCGQFTFIGDYFRRSEEFRQSAQPPPRQSQLRLYQARLLLERSQQLLRSGGLGAFLLPPDLWHHDNAARLRQWLQAENRILNLIEVSNQQGALGDVPARTAASLLWLEKGATTPGEKALTPIQPPTPDDLWTLLQSPIHLTEEGVEVG